MITIGDIQIFITTHNRASLVGESIQSLLNQTAGVKEITVLDNESSDNTEQVVSSYKGKGVSYIKTFGFLGNFNKAKELADKKYVMLFHDDDILHPQYLEKALAVLNKEENIAAFYSRYTEFKNDDSPKSFSPLKNAINRGGGYYLFENQKDFAIFMFFLERIAYATAIYKTDLFKKIDLEYDKFSKFNDWPFMVKFGEYGKIALLADENAYHVRLHSRQDTWTFVNAPTADQILNSDKFFFDIFFKSKDQELEKIYSRKATYFYLGKCKAFVSPQEMSKYSEADIRSLAKQKGLFDSDQNLVSKQEYDSWLRAFSEKRLHPICQDGQADGDMDLAEKLEVFIITYNRKNYLKHTLEQVYSDKSPIRNLQITILDNKSNDGTGELIDKTIANFPNSRHVIHNRNIGGNANIARCYELAQKDYFWILCDDDEIDWRWETWRQVEEAMEDGADAIVVSNYINPKENIPQLLGQLSFVPAGIYKTANLTDTIMQNISFQISCCFPQLALPCKLINDGKKFTIIDDWIVKMVQHPESSYSRGMDNDKHPLMTNMTWSLGFLKTIQMISNEKLREEIIKNYHNENGTFMLHPDVFLGENEKLGEDSFVNQQEYYSLLPRNVKYAFFYELHNNRTEFREREYKREVEELKKSFNYRVGAMVLFLPKLMLRLFKRGRAR